MAKAGFGLCLVGLVLVAAGSGFGAPKRRCTDDLPAGGGTGEKRIDARPAIDVYLDDPGLLGPGTPLASAIFTQIGVCLGWHTGELRAGHGAIGIRTADDAPQSASMDALASTRLLASSGAQITVYRDRVRRFLAEHRSSAGAAAGYVLAHELAHVMQGVARHSESGILRAKWSNYDYKQMALHTLAFTQVDVELIHQGLADQIGKPVVRVGGGDGEQQPRDLKLG